MDAKIVAKGGILPIEIRDKYVDIVVPLVPENLESNVKKFYAFQSGGKLPVELIIRNGGVELIYERYRLRKVSSLP